MCPLEDSPWTSFLLHRLHLSCPLGAAWPLDTVWADTSGHVCRCVPLCNIGVFCIQAAINKVSVGQCHEGQDRGEPCLNMDVAEIRGSGLTIFTLAP